MTRKELEMLLMMTQISQMLLKQNIELKKKLAAKPDMIFKSSKDLIEYRKECQQ